MATGAATGAATGTATGGLVVVGMLRRERPKKESVLGDCLGGAAVRSRNGAVRERVDRIGTCFGILVGAVRTVRGCWVWSMRGVWASGGISFLPLLPSFLLLLQNWPLFFRVLLMPGLV